MFGKTTTMTFKPSYGPEKTFTLPADAHAWQLFSSMKGSGLVAHRLTKALIKALNKLVEVAEETGDLKQGVLAAERMHSKVRYARHASNHGAGDTEPRYVAQQAISDFARAWSGDQYMDFYDCF